MKKSEMNTLIEAINNTTTYDELQEVISYDTGHGKLNNIFETINANILKYRNPKLNKTVLVIDKKWLPDEGISAESYYDNEDIINLYSKLEVIPRYEAEYSNRYKQIIPSLLLYSTDDNDNYHFWVLKNIGGNEKRLLNTHSLVGGHIDIKEEELPPSRDTFSLLLSRELFREMDEEITNDNIYAISMDAEICYTNNTSSVGKRHLLMCYTHKIPYNQIIVAKEKENHEACMIDEEDVNYDMPNINLNDYAYVAINEFLKNERNKVDE